MHFVRLDGLKPGTSYQYRVRSANDSSWSLWSATHTFRFGTMSKFAMFGDMGVFEWNNMANLLADADSESIDAVLMLGDVSAMPRSAHGHFTELHMYIDNYL
eukprot:SAG31_NODE_9612_length_1251_cov_0.877604_1_plen_102_part_00